jgi:hypothetical protein
MLAGLVGISIPIIIHLLNRRRARVVDWGAMQFLADSVAARNRRIQIEELLLMILRCLLLAALAAALARPFLVSGNILSLNAKDAQDVAIVIDGSMSMTIETDGKSAFQRAVEEARQVVDACRPGDAVSVILAGALPQAVIPSPVSDHDALHKALGELAPPGGSMAAADALSAAVESLRGGTNPAKKVIVITDGQRIGWDLAVKQKWDFLARSGETFPTKPLVIVRTLAAPARWRNATISALSFSRPVVGTDRPVKITVTVANTGKEGIKPAGVELAVDGKVVEDRAAEGFAAIPEGGASSRIFEYRFETPGPHRVSAHLAWSESSAASAPDDLHGDDKIARVVNVIKALPVLVIEGRTSATPSQSDSSYILDALTAAEPAEGDDLPDKPGGAKPAPLFVPTVKSAADIRAVTDFSPYAAVILADVPRLPVETARKLAEYVAAGGGLLIAPGEKAEGDFYNNWSPAQGAGRLGGAKLVEIKNVEPSPEQKDPFVHVSAGTLDHPALKLLADPAVSDLARATVKRYWVLDPDKDDQDVSVGGRLEPGAPFLVQRKVQRGFVLTLAIPLDTRFSNLPILFPSGSYLVLVHELVMFLAAPNQPAMNLRAGEQFTYAIPGKLPAGSAATVTGPDAKRAPATLRQAGNKWQAVYALTMAPGLYTLHLPPAAAGDLPTDTAPASATAPARFNVPFVVMDDPNESRLELLGKDDLAIANQYIPTVRAASLAELTAAIAGTVPGSEIWRAVAMVLLCLLVAEAVATRAIAAHRKSHVLQGVAFGATQVDADKFRAAAAGAVATQGRGDVADGLTGGRGEGRP